MCWELRREVVGVLDVLGVLSYDAALSVHICERSWRWIYMGALGRAGYGMVDRDTGFPILQVTISWFKILKSLHDSKKFSL